MKSAPCIAGRTFGVLVALALLAAPPRLRAVEETEAEPTPHQRVYYFEHTLLPKWTHHSNGVFFAHLSQNSLAPLLEAATEIVGAEFAQQLVVRVLPDANRILLTFQAPRDPPLCFFALVEKDGAAFRYLTLEKTEDFLGNGTKSVVGEWTADGRHLNQGPRLYDDEASFLAELAAGKKEGP